MLQFLLSLLINVAAVVAVVLAVAKLTLFFLTIVMYINALVVSAKPRSVLLLLRQVLLAIHVTHDIRHFVILHTHRLPDQQRSQVQVSYIHEKMSVCKPNSCLDALCFAEGSGPPNHMTHNELVSSCVRVLSR